MHGDHTEYTVGDYLLDRLAEVGVRDLFGVPGDYNLAFLDHVVDHEGIRWVGNANELNAAYAADGYARVNGVGALLTTFGVGELSAINGVAGAYAEYLPVIHVVGAPSTAAQEAGALLHHTLGDGDFGHFLRAHAEVTVAQAALTARNAVTEIDRVIAASLRERRPGYLVLPTDVAAAPAPRPAGPLTVPAPELSGQALEDFTATARRMLVEADSLTVLADFLADRFGARQDIAELVEAGSVPNATLLTGKGVFDESGPHFSGVYTGAPSDKPVRLAVEDTDLLISVGVRFTDTVTTGFSQRVNPERTIDIQPFATRIGDREFGPLPMREAVGRLTGLVRELGRRWDREDTRVAPAPEPQDTPDAALSQARLWDAVGGFLRPGDIVVAEQGTSVFGMQAVRLPSGVTFIGQPLWGSIGFTLPAALGAQAAAPGRRTVLLIGDGSAQLTAQEFGTIVRDGHPLVTVLINNDGYTVERAIHGPEQPYNDIARWNWSLVPAAMGGADATVLRAGTPAELAEALRAAADPEGLVLLEAVLPRMDVPEFLDAVSRSIAERNSRGTA